MPSSRLDAIRRLLRQLEGERAHLTPAEYFRDASHIAGWTVKRGTTGKWSVQRDGVGEKEVSRDKLIDILQNEWAPLAREILTHTPETP